MPSGPPLVQVSWAVSVRQTGVVSVRSHLPVPQSPPAAHSSPTMQRFSQMEPPQSTSVSPPSCALLKQEVQTLLVRWLKRQSAVASQAAALQRSLYCSIT